MGFPNRHAYLRVPAQQRAMAYDRRSLHHLHRQVRMTLGVKLAQRITDPELIEQLMKQQQEN